MISTIPSCGVAIGQEQIITRICDQYSNNLFGSYCSSGSSNTQAQVKYGLIAGLAMQFQFTKH